MIWDIYRPVLVLVLPKIGKRPDWTGLSSTRREQQNLLYEVVMRQMPAYNTTVYYVVCQATTGLLSLPTTAETKKSGHGGTAIMNS